MAVLVNENTKVICQGFTGSQGARLRAGLIAFAVAVTGFAMPGHAADAHLKDDLRLFEEICVQAAPKLSEKEIRKTLKKLAASKIKLGPGTMFNAANGRSCTTVFAWGNERLNAVPQSDANRIVQSFADRIGATDVALEAGRNGNALKYTVKAPKTKFTLSFEVENSKRRLAIARSRSLSN
ncbi:MAG: hypothetical protein LBE86_07385 [Gemmobacter sp.]|jgi:succinyl-CoA synthetase alpha subunit|nr:hypothetical protein [Gemmobacter sp.]